MSNKSNDADVNKPNNGGRQPLHDPRTVRHEMDEAALRITPYVQGQRKR